MIVVACVAILVVGPKDLPKMLRSFGKALTSLKRMAGDFQRHFDDALKEADLDDLKNIASPANFSPVEDAKNSMEDLKKIMETSVVDESSAKPAKAKPRRAKSAPVKRAAKRAAKPIPARAKAAKSVKPAKSAS